MKAQITKKVLTYSLVTVMFVSHSASAEVWSWGKSEPEIKVSNNHPCAMELQRELEQVKIMEATKAVIDKDSSLRTLAGAGATAVGASEAISSAVSGDWVSAGINLVGTAIMGAKTIKEEKQGLRAHFDLKSGIEERKKNLRLVLASPQMCTENVRKAFLTQFILDTKSRNRNYLAVINTAIDKAEGNITPIQNGILVGAGVALAIGTVVAVKTKTYPLATFVIGAAAFGTGVAGIGGYIADYAYNIPTLNDLKAQKSQIETIDSQMDIQLKQLAQAN